MVHVDFTSKNLTRTAKPIVSFFRNVADYGINITNTWMVIKIFLTF